MIFTWESFKNLFGLKNFNGTHLSKNNQQTLLDNENFQIILLEDQNLQENLLEHECVNSKEAEASPSSDHEGCPRFVHVAPSAERHLAFRDVQRNFKVFVFHKKMMMITMMMPRFCTSCTQRRETPDIWI